MVFLHGVLYDIFMKYLIIVSLVFAVVGASGCTSLGGMKNATGGIMRSEDTGRTFELRGTIDEKHSLAQMNVLSIAIDPVNSSTVYVGTDRNGVYVSTDASLSWKQIDVKLSNIHNIIIDPSHSQTLYVSGIYNGRGSVIRSDDGGVNWRRVYVEPENGTNITSMAVSQYGSGAVYIGTSGGTIARTTNGGESWENLYHADNSVEEILIDAGNSSTLYALISGMDIVRTQDNGATFDSVRKLTRERSVQLLYEGKLFSMTISPTASGTIFVGTDKGIFRSTDYGQSWTSMDVIASTIGIPIHAITISPHNADQIMYAAAKAVYTSVPNGWVITDTASDRIVDVIKYDPINSQVVYIGLKQVK